MNRSEKRKIRQKINNLLDSYCKGCQYNGKNDNKNCINHCPVGARMQALSKVLFEGIEKQPSIFDEAFDAGEYTRRPWTVEEDFYLLNHFHLASSVHLATKFDRTPVAVEQRYKLLTKEQKKEAVR